MGAEWLTGARLLRRIRALESSMGRGVPYQSAGPYNGRAGTERLNGLARDLSKPPWLYQQGRVPNDWMLDVESAVVSIYDAASLAIFASFTTPPTTARKGVIDTCVRALKTAGIWTKLDGLYMPAAADGQAALINWVHPGTYNATLVNSPSFVADWGYQSDVVPPKYIDTGFNPSTAPSPKFVQDSASVFAWNLSDYWGNGLLGSGSDVAGDTYLAIGAWGYYRVNSTAYGDFSTPANSVPPTTQRGLWVATRYSSTSVKVHYNAAVEMAAMVDASVPPTSSSIKILAGYGVGNYQGYAGLIGCAGFGSQLSVADITALYGILGNYLKAIEPAPLLDTISVPAVRAYSTRLLRSAHIGLALRVRRASDNYEFDVGFNGQDFDVNQLLRGPPTESYYVVKWYDQSGSADDCVQATVANQARIVNVGVLDVRNGKACPLFDGVDDTYASASSFQFYTGSVVVAINNAGPNFPDYSGIFSSVVNLVGLIGTNGTPHFYSPASTNGGSVRVNNASGPDDIMIFGGVLTQINCVAPTLYTSGDGFRISGDRDTLGVRFWPGWIGEIMTFSTDLSSTNDTAMYTNQKAYWGTP